MHSPSQNNAHLQNSSVAVECNVRLCGSLLMWLKFPKTSTCNEHTKKTRGGFQKWRPLSGVAWSYELEK